LVNLKHNSTYETKKKTHQKDDEKVGDNKLG